MVISWQKRLLRFDPSLKRLLEEKIELIIKGNLNGLDIKQLKGYNNLFRCRIGKTRIIFINTNEKIEIKYIGYRGDVYKGL